PGAPPALRADRRPSRRDRPIRAPCPRRGAAPRPTAGDRRCRAGPGRTPGASGTARPLPGASAGLAECRRPPSRCGGHEPWARSHPPATLLSLAGLLEQLGVEILALLDEPAGVL